MTALLDGLLGENVVEPELQESNRLLVETEVESVARDQNDRHDERHH